jgi:uncharacterized protein (PEP-CTERM system associated)
LQFAKRGVKSILRGGFCCALGTAAFCVGGPASAGDWRVTPSITAEETYTNNFRLAEDKESSFITRVSPGVALRGEGRRFNADLNYRLDGLAYSADTDSNRFDNSLFGRASLEAVENFFFIDTRASIRQQFLSPFGAQQTDTSSDSNNRYTASTYGISPYIKGRLFSDITYSLRNDASWTNSGNIDNSSISNSTTDGFTNEITGRIETPIKTFGAALEYNREDTDYDSGRELKTEIKRGIGYYRVDQSLVVSARGGHENNDFGGGEESGAVYGFGLNWNPSARTSFDGFWEHRYFGSSYQLNFMHRQRRTVFRLRASRDISNFNNNLNFTGLSNADFLSAIARSVDPSATPQDVAIVVDKLLTNLNLPRNGLVSSALFSEDATIQQRLEAALVLEGVRNIVTFSVYSTKNESATSGNTTFLIPGVIGSTNPFVQVQDLKQRGASVAWALRVTPLMSATTTLTRLYSTASEPSDFKTTQDTLGLRLTRTLSTKTNGWTGLRFTRSSSDTDVNGVGLDYNEAAIYAGIDHRF